MIPKSFIDDLVIQTDLVDLLRSEGGVSLKKRGAYFSGCCPFHNEKTPSFFIKQGNNFYHCFGCGASGNAISFLMDYMNMTFIEAIKHLAERLGVEVPEERRLSTQEKKKIEQKKQLQTASRSIMDEVTDFYHKNLRSFAPAYRYLNERGLTKEAIEYWKIGYAPPGFNHLKEIFRNYPSKELLELGLVKIREDGNGRQQIYDTFRDRVMFPIRNRKGEIVGYGGRVIEKAEPKYLNSPDSPIFQKGQLLFGLYDNLKSINLAKQIIVVEGYMDVIGLWQRGIQYAVATLGTATTVDHARILMQYSKIITFCFDGDNAGRNAAWKAFKQIIPIISNDATIKFLFLPSDEDPDSFTKRYGKEAFEEKLRTQSISLGEYFVQHVLSNKDLKTNEGITQALLESAEIFLMVNPKATLLSRVMENDFISRVSNLSRRSVNEVQELFKISCQQKVDETLRQEQRREEAQARVRDREMMESEENNSLKQFEGYQSHMKGYRRAHFTKETPYNRSSHQSSQKGYVDSQNPYGFPSSHESWRNDRSYNGSYNGGNQYSGQGRNFGNGNNSARPSYNGYNRFNRYNDFYTGPSAIEGIYSFDDRLRILGRMQLKDLIAQPCLARYVDLPEYVVLTDEIEALKELAGKLLEKAFPQIEEVISDLVFEESPYKETYEKYLSEYLIEKAQDQKIDDKGNEVKEKENMVAIRQAFYEGNRNLKNMILKKIIEEKMNTKRTPSEERFIAEFYSNQANKPKAQE